MEFDLENLERAAQLETSGNWREMLKHCSMWKVAEPTNYLAWQGVGDALTHFGKDNEAIAMYQQALKLVPAKPTVVLGATMSSAPVWYRLGNAFVKRGKIEQAIDAFLHGVNTDSNAGVIWNNLGIAYLEKGDAKNGIEAFRRAIRASPHDPSFLRNLGIAYARCNMHDGVRIVHELLAALDAGVAKEFLINATQILAAP